MDDSLADSLVGALPNLTDRELDVELGCSHLRFLASMPALSRLNLFTDPSSPVYPSAAAIVAGLTKLSDVCATKLMTLELVQLAEGRDDDDEEDLCSSDAPPLRRRGDPAASSRTW